MEGMKLKINDVDRFDEVIKNSLPEVGDLEIITKDAGTVLGRGLVMVTFTVQQRDGQLVRAQAVTTMRNFRAIANGIAATYTDEGLRTNMADPLDDGIIEEGSNG